MGAVGRTRCSCDIKSSPERAEMLGRLRVASGLWCSPLLSRGAGVSSIASRGAIRRNVSVKENQDEDGKVVVITSGKGGVGKTTTAASMAMGLALKGFRTCAIDFDVGLRNLDIHLGMERRIIYDFVNVINDECKLNQALVKDKRCPNMHLLAASQTKDKTALKEDGVERVLKELRSSFDFIVCDSPAGIEAGAYQAMLFSDVAIVCTNPELSSVRDSDKMIGFISSNSSRARKELPPVEQLLIITRYNPTRVEQEDMLSVTDIKEMLGLPLLGVIPDVPEVLSSINMGKPVIMHKDSKASGAYQDAIDRFFGEERELRFISPESKGLFSRLFG